MQSIWLVMIYTENNYKAILKNRVKDLQKTRKDLTLKGLANQLGVQATYFSKFFNSDSTHLNDDHLYLLLSLLDFSNNEIEYIYLLKSAEQTQNKERLEYLQAKIETFQKENPLNIEQAITPMDRIEAEMSYLLDPLCLLVHMALYIEDYRNFPFRLCETLNITNQKFEEILRTLASNDLIKLDEQFRIKEVKTKKIHYGKDHPLMRVHQSLFKTKINSELLRVEEKDKHSILVSFTADEFSFEKIKVAHNKFMKEVELIAKEAKNQGVYQINFDVFKWL